MIALYGGITKSASWQLSLGALFLTTVMKWIKVFFGNLIVFSALFGALEIAVRAFAPDYSDAYFAADVTRGYEVHLNQRWGHRVGKDQIAALFDSSGKMERRVLFVGDSVTFGYGLPYEKTYHQIARRHLTDSGCIAQVHGLGRLHTNLPKLLNSELGDFVWNGFRPHILIYQFQANDVPLNEIPRKAASEQGWRDWIDRVRITYLNRSAFLKWIQSVVWQSIHRRQNESLASSILYAGDSDPALYKRSWDQFESDILNFKTRFAEHGIEFHIMISPESYDISTADIDNDLGFNTSTIKIWPAEKVRLIAQRYGIPLFDPRLELRRYRSAHPNKRLYFPNDASHPNILGHELIGAAAGSYLESLRLCP